MSSNSMERVLHEAYLRPFKVQSDFAREFAQEVGALSSMGYITTAEAPGFYGRTWRCTGYGMEHLREGGLV
jgi:hypothetical protein